MVSCQKGPTRHAYAWQIGPFWQDTLDLSSWTRHDIERFPTLPNLCPGNPPAIDEDLHKT